MLHQGQQCPEEDERHTDDVDVDAAAAGDVDVDADDPPYIYSYRDGDLMMMIEYFAVLQTHIGEKAETSNQ